MSFDSNSGGKWWCGLVCGLFATAVRAEEAVASEMVTLDSIMTAGGWTLRLIMLLSAVALFLTIYFLFSFRSSVLLPRSFMDEIGQAAEQGDLVRLKTICGDHPSPAARTIAAAAEQVEISGQVDYFAVRDAVEDEGGRQAGALWQRLQYLLDIAIVAPMLGLLGTVLGMLRSFADLQTEIGGVNPQTLSQGVAQALITTAGGLIVGIMAMILYSVFRGRLAGLIAGMEEACNRIMRLFINNFWKKQP